MKIEFDEQCRDCHGTGLYKGLAERDGAAVVCHSCKGTGCYHFVHTYEEFTGRKPSTGIKRVFEVNPGIVIGEGKNEGKDFTLEQFGGMPYADWASGKQFPAKSENRKYTCPCWWYQFADYKRKPKWDKCQLGVTFTQCRHFCDKEQCWKQWDKEAILQDSRQDGGSAGEVDLDATMDAANRRKRLKPISINESGRKP